MPPPAQQPLPSRGSTREAVALIEVGHTTISAAARRLLLAVFTLAIAMVPVTESAGVRELVLEAVRSARQSAPASAGPALWRRIVARNRMVLSAIAGFERRLEEESAIGRALRPPAQSLLAGWLDAGNERVYIGHDGWLFFRDDVEYVTGPGFLHSRQIAKRIESAAEWTAPPSPDPRGALMAFHQDLQARGVTLIVMPTPVKPTVHPESLAADARRVSAPLHNASYVAFIAELRRRGVLVFDPTEALVAARRTGAPYLATDTHWRPEAMEAVADLAAAFVMSHARLPDAGDPGYRLERVEAQNTGDTARMLDLPRVSALYPPETVWLRRVVQADGSPWRSSRESDVLVLGDSFSNIYSLASMEWGTSAGFVEQLSYTLRRPVDRLIQNDDGAFATRALLQQDPARLIGKRVVLYQFAVRELAQGDWKVLPVSVSGER
jgi:alginate O-acetyltransferase complex protein AlgJ